MIWCLASNGIEARLSHQHTVGQKPSNRFLQAIPRGRFFGNISPKGQRTEQSGNGKSISLFKILSYCTEIVLADSSKPGTVTCLSGSGGNSFEGWYNEFCRIYLSLIDMILIRSQFQRHRRSGEADWTQSP